MISSEMISERIFKILKGNGNKIEMFTDEGEYTIDPEDARRYYLPDTFMMINLDENDSKREMRVSISAGTEISEIKPLLNQLKKLANRSIIEYTLKQYTKNIEPKDFDSEAQRTRDMNTENSVNEAISTAYGSSKSSYQKLESARLIIKHDRAVNEESKGSRSRNIGAIFVETSDGERHLLATKNLNAGRAMLRHVKEGGLPYDAFGKHIIEQSNELSKLKEFKRYSKNNKLEEGDTADIMEAVEARIEHIREALKKLKGSRCYETTFAAFESADEQLDENDYGDIRNKFTVQYFDETLESALPYVHTLVQEMNALRERDQMANDTLSGLADFINNATVVNLQSSVKLSDDPENPMVNDTLKGAPKNSQLGAVMEYLTTVIGDNEKELSVLLSKSADLVDNVDDDAILASTAQALTALLPKLKVASGKRGVPSDEYDTQIENVVESFDFNKLFT
tara:strand:- start:3855 stop:5216 length:1362 start_codon:yes stop_codon:yes gene_type:complete